MRFALYNYAKHAPLAKSEGIYSNVCYHLPPVSISSLCSLNLLRFVFQNGVKHLSRQFNIYLPKVNKRSLKTNIQYVLSFLFADGNTGLASMDDISYLCSPIFCLSKQHQGASEKGKRNPAKNKMYRIIIHVGRTSEGHLAQTPLKATSFFRSDLLFVQRRCR